MPGSVEYNILSRYQLVKRNRFLGHLMSQIQISRETEEFLEDLIAELAVPPSRYEQAERSYHSLGDWLVRPNSSEKEDQPTVRRVLNV